MLSFRTLCFCTVPVYTLLLYYDSLYTQLLAQAFRLLPQIDTYTSGTSQELKSQTIEWFARIQEFQDFSNFCIFSGEILRISRCVCVCVSLVWGWLFVGLMFACSFVVVFGSGRSSQLLLCSPKPPPTEV